MVFWIKNCEHETHVSLKQWTLVIWAEEPAVIKKEISIIEEK